MNDFYKIFNFFRKEYRASNKLHLFEADGYYWITQGYVLARVPVSVMEINPALCKEVDFTELLNKEKGENLENLDLQHVDRSRNLVLIPLKGKDFTVWLNKKYLDLFPKSINLCGKSSIDPVLVYSGGTVIGLIQPVRYERELPTLYDIAQQ